MKKLLLALLLVSGIVSAEEFWTAPTDAGGRIVLVFSKIDNCGDHLWFMYIEKSNQSVEYGCWAILNHKVHIRLDNGIRRVYDSTGWTQNGVDK